MPVAVVRRTNVRSATKNRTTKQIPPIPHQSPIAQSHRSEGATRAVPRVKRRRSRSATRGEHSSSTPRPKGAQEHAGPIFHHPFGVLHKKMRSLSTSCASLHSWQHSCAPSVLASMQTHPNIKRSQTSPRRYRFAHACCNPIGRTHDSACVAHDVARLRIAP